MLFDITNNNFFRTSSITEKVIMCRVAVKKTILAIRTFDKIFMTLIWVHNLYFND